VDDRHEAAQNLAVRRVLLSRMPQILRDILEHAILQQPDLQLLAEGWLCHPGGSAPDVVVVAAGSHGVSRAPLALLRRWPGARVIVVAPTEGEVALYELKPHVTELGPVSASEIVQAIRA
jgi:succinylglutamate desuccinylase